MLTLVAIGYLKRHFIFYKVDISNPYAVMSMLSSLGLSDGLTIQNYSA